MSQFEVPILLITFNRPKETKTLLQKIEYLHPKNLYIASDGPRDDRDLNAINKM